MYCVGNEYIYFKCDGNDLSSMETETCSPTSQVL
jgi:hypothetical protein